MTGSFTKRAAVSLLAFGVALGVTACASDEAEHAERVKEMERRAVLAQECHDSGGRYVLTVPPGYTSASYWCIWDSEKEGGEW